MAKEAKVKLTADNRNLKRGLKDSNKSVNVFEKGVGAAGKALMKFAGPLAIGAALKGLVSMAKELATNADRLLDLEQITNISTDTLQEYEHVARVAGVNSEFFANAVIGLTQRLSRGAEMSASLKQGLDALNISVTNSDGSMRNFGQVAEEAIEQLAEMENVSQRNTIGAQLFSGAWKDLAPVLSLGADGIEQAKKEARELGLVMDGEALKAANEFRVELETTTARFKMFKQNIGLLAMPAINTLIDGMERAVDGFKIMTGLMKKTDMVMGTPQSQVDEFLKSIDHITDQHERREKLMNEVFFLQKQYNSLLESEDANQRAIGESMMDQRRIIEENFNKYAEMKINEQKKAEEAAEAARLAEEAAEKERRKSLGDIGRLQEDIATAEASYIAANSESERSALIEQIRLLKEKLSLIKQSSESGQSNEVEDFLSNRPSSPQPMQSMGAGTLPTLQPDQYVESLNQIGEAVDNNKDKFQEWQLLAEQSAYQVGAALGELAGDSDKSTSEIIKNLLSQVMAQLISQIVATVPFPANIAIASGAGVLSTTLFNQVPGYADGTDYHPGGMAWVGEKGPELVNLPRGSSVMTNKESMMQGMTDVKFIIQGDKLVGVLNRYSNRIKTNA